MTRKTTLRIAIFFILVPVSFIPSIAQQSRASKGNLLVQIRRPSIDPLNSVFPLRIHTPYRSINGTNNNISSSSKTTWGCGRYNFIQGNAGAIWPK